MNLHKKFTLWFVFLNVATRHFHTNVYAAFVPSISPPATGSLTSTCTGNTIDGCTPSSSSSSPSSSSHATTGVSSSLKFSRIRSIQGASPTIGRSHGPLLFAKKNKDSTVGKSGKIQVKLLKHVAGTGSAGDVVMVAPAFFMNKLQKTGSAIRITDEQVEKECTEKAQQDKEARDSANYLKEKLETMTIVMSKKAGPDGQLFGGIGLKAILSELEKEFPQGTLSAKYIKITQVKDENGQVLKHDIKSIGNYTATIALLKDISADFQLSVTGE